MPHTFQRFVDILHDLWWRVAPTKLEQLLPDMASVAMDDRLRNATEQFVNHDGFVVLGNNVERFLNYVATKCIHTQAQSVATDGIRYSYYLLRGTVFEAALYKKVAKAIYH